MVPSDAAARHRAVAGVFTERVLGTRDWTAVAPVPGWAARDVVDHLVSWLPGFLAMGSGVRLPVGPTANLDPVGAWRVHADGVQAVLDDAATAEAVFSHSHTGTLPLATAIDRFYTADVFMHTWDLARATGQDPALDPDFCGDLLAGMEAMEELIRGSGQYGPAVPVAPDADPQTRLLGFIGRDPLWAASTQG